MSVERWSDELREDLSRLNYYAGTAEWDLLIFAAILGAVAEERDRCARVCRQSIDVYGIGAYLSSRILAGD